MVERVTPDGHANVVFAKAASAFYDPSSGMNREWWRDKATIIGGVLTMTGFRIFRYAFDGPDRLYLTATNSKSGGITSGALVRADAARLAAGDRPVEWPWPGERIWIPHLTLRTPDGARPIMLEATFYPPAGGARLAPLAIFSHGSDIGRNQLRLPMAGNCPAYGRGRCCSPASHAAGFSRCTMPASSPARSWEW